MLDAPGLRDDYYVNLLGWSTQNVIAVALHDSVWLWHGATSKVGIVCAGSTTIASWLPERRVDGTSCYVAVADLVLRRHLKIGSTVPEILPSLQRCDSRGYKRLISSIRSAGFTSHAHRGHAADVRGMVLARHLPGAWHAVL